MSKDYRDIKSLDTEAEGDIHLIRAPAGYASSQSWGRCVCSGRCLICTLMGLLCIIVISTIAFGFAGRKFDSGISEMQEEFNNMNRTVSAVLAALTEKEANDLKMLININKMAKNLTMEVNKVKLEFQEQITKFRKSVWTLNCKLEDIKHSRTGGHEGCCPKGWRLFSRSCYWVSSMVKTWEEAKVDCEDKDSHLVVITSYQEQQFVIQHTKPRNTWIGLTLETDRWKWVDGSTYTMRRIDWRPGEPNSFSHDYRMSAHCVHLYRDGLWSDENCMHQYAWMCETETKA